MKKRTFYIINLDRNRILILGVLFVGFILIAFATGFRFGKVQIAESKTQRASDRQNNGLNSHATRDNENLQNSDDPNGASVYSLRERNNQRDQNNLRNNGTRDTGAMTLRDRANQNTSASNRPRRMYNRGSETSRQNQSSNSERVARNAPRTNHRTTGRTGNRNTGRPSTRTTRTGAATRNNRSSARNTTRPTNRNPDTALLDVRGRTTRFNNTARNSASTSNSRTNSSGARSRPAGGSIRRSATPARATRSRSNRNGVEKIYALQVGSYSKKNSAGNIAKTLKRQGFHAYISRSGSRYNVRVGRTTDKGQIKKLRKKLVRKSYAPITISYKRN